MITNTIICQSEEEFKTTLSKYMTESLTEGNNRMALPASEDGFNETGVCVYEYKVGAEDSNEELEKTTNIFLPLKVLLTIPEFVAIYNRFEREIARYFTGAAQDNSNVPVNINNS
jgi:hypothetical protein